MRVDGEKGHLHQSVSEIRTGYLVGYLLLHYS